MSILVGLLDIIQRCSGLSKRLTRSLIGVVAAAILLPGSSALSQYLLIDNNFQYFDTIATTSTYDSAWVKSGFVFIDSTVTVLHNMRVDGIITHSHGNAHGLQLVVAGRLDLNGVISANACGGRGAYKGSPYGSFGEAYDEAGPLQGAGATEQFNAGASYGGYGVDIGARSNPPYGTTEWPTTLGSGGAAYNWEPDAPCQGLNEEYGGAGGGAIRIDAGYLHVASTARIEANGTPGYFGGGGSGGSILISADTLLLDYQDDPVITANGGGDNACFGARFSYSGGGGGGRIALYYDFPTIYDIEDAVTASGGVGGLPGVGNLTAGSGTIYSRKTGEYGDLCVWYGSDQFTSIHTTADTLRDLRVGRGCSVVLEKELKVVGQLSISGRLVRLD